MIFATAGHVDHGKTTLVGALTGVETDRLEEEKRRGLSIELGFAYVPLGERRVGFVDVPGHERFIRNMLSGVSAIDAALLVVAADDGVMPQTREHLDILHLLNIPTGIIAITRSDLVDPDRITEVQQELKELTRGTFLDGQPMLPVSAPNDLGVNELRDALSALGYRDRTSAGSRQARFTVDRSFVLRGAGLTVTGSLIDGSLKVGDRLLIAGSTDEVRVRGLHALGQEAENADAGQRCALNLTGIDREQLGRGAWLVHPDNATVSNRVDGTYMPLTTAQLDPLRSRDRRVHVHAGASHTTGRLTLLQEGDEPLVQLVLEDALPLRFDDRVVLREASDQRTVGALRVLDAPAPSRGRQRPERLESLRAIAENDGEDALNRIAQSLAEPIDLGAFLACRGLPVTETSPGATELAHWTYRGKHWATHRERFDAVRAAVVKAIDGWHKASPQTSGMRLNQLLPIVRPSLPPTPHGLLEAALEHCVAEGELLRASGLLRRPGHQARLTGADRELWDKIEPQLQGTRQPPVTREISKATGIGHNELLKFLGRIAPLGLTVKVADNRYFLPETIDDLRGVLEEVAAADPDGHITPIAYRDATGIGRNLAIGLLEHFDQRGITRRNGDYRILTGLGSL